MIHNGNYTLTNTKTIINDIKTIESFKFSIKPFYSITSYIFEFKCATLNTISMKTGDTLIAGRFRIVEINESFMSLTYTMYLTKDITLSTTEIINHSFIDIEVLNLKQKSIVESIFKTVVEYSNRKTFENPDLLTIIKLQKLLDKLVK